MSVQEQIFINADSSPDEVAEQLAASLSMRKFAGSKGGVYVSRPARWGVSGGKEVGGEVADNYLADAQASQAEQSLLDGYQILWDFGYTGRDRDIQLAEARLAFTELAASALWPAALIAGLDTLIAAWDPVLGLTWFPPGTTPDADSRQLWYRYFERLAQPHT
ncbi:hypothetical protein GCM10009541_57420 [Micromonospora gifhornensis]|uniref:Uncharacterized protein n=1 Tax=Micromonospora gifhornensis TaxID=84594 RepID=A0ABQ4IJ75_9ACTN|nr:MULTISPECIES: hypothetical protein [Micromonospora]PMR60452.1 hypothetical protein C1A38_14085 [Verrucosispora sp. ts21]GIJ17950.1 hypothetical protein Vgi01_46340 [Micromonospora gifhornensis]